MFFDTKKGGGSVATAILHSNKDGSMTTQPEAPSYSDLELLAHEMLAAVEKKDVHALIDAFRSMWTCLEASEPQE